MAWLAGRWQEAKKRSQTAGHPRTARLLLASRTACTLIYHIYISRHTSTGERDYVTLLFEIREERKRLMGVPPPA